MYNLFFCFVFCFSATQLARQVHQERTQVVCSNKVAQKRLTPRHSRNHDGPGFEVDVLVCWEWIEESEIIVKDLLFFESRVFIENDTGYLRDAEVT